MPDQALLGEHALLLWVYREPDLREEWRSLPGVRASVNFRIRLQSSGNRISTSRRSTMSKKIKWVSVVLCAAVMGTGVVALLSAPPASAASSCWQVDCNTCCRGAHGGVICTQRACV
jgi:hypothetical protein